MTFTATKFDSLSPHSYVYARQLCPHVLPFSAATLWRKVKAGTFPAPVKLSERVTAWRVEDVREWLKAPNAGALAAPKAEVFTATKFDREYQGDEDSDEFMMGSPHFDIPYPPAPRADADTMRQMRDALQKAWLVLNALRTYRDDAELLALLASRWSRTRSNGMGKKPPTGFVAICQCGVVVRALDYGRVDRETAGHMLHRWLDNGLTVEPRFANTWRVTVEACRCDPDGKNPNGGHE